MEQLTPTSSLGSGITIQKPPIQEVSKKVKKLVYSFHCYIDTRQNFTFVIQIHPVADSL